VLSTSFFTFLVLFALGPLDFVPRSPPFLALVAGPVSLLSLLPRRLPLRASFRARLSRKAPTPPRVPPCFYGFVALQAFDPRRIAWLSFPFPAHSGLPLSVLFPLRLGVNFLPLTRMQRYLLFSLGSWIPLFVRFLFSHSPPSPWSRGWTGHGVFFGAIERDTPTF